MKPDATQPLRQIRIVGQNHAAVASRTQVLSGKKAQRYGVTKATDRLSVVLGPDRLRTIPHDVQPVAIRNLGNSADIGCLPVQVYRQYSTSPTRNLVLYARRVDVQRSRVDIDKDRPCSEQTHSFNSRNESERRSDHLITFMDTDG